jgi:hypothetical protein
MESRYACALSGKHSTDQQMRAVSDWLRGGDKPLLGSERDDD